MKVHLHQNKRLVTAGREGTSSTNDKAHRVVTLVKLAEHLAVQVLSSRRLMNNFFFCGFGWSFVPIFRLRFMTFSETLWNNWRLIMMVWCCVGLEEVLSEDRRTNNRKKKDSSSRYRGMTGHKRIFPSFWTTWKRGKTLHQCYCSSQ